MCLMFRRLYSLRVYINSRYYRKTYLVICYFIPYKNSHDFLT